MQMRAVGIGFVLLLVAGCGRSGMSLNAGFEANARPLSIVRDQEAPHTTRMTFGNTTVENFAFSSQSSSSPTTGAGAGSQAVANLGAFVGAARGVVTSDERNSSFVDGVFGASTELLQIAGGKTERDETSGLSFELTHARERFTSTCESTLRFDTAGSKVEQTALVCSIITSKGVSFTLQVRAGERAEGRLLRSGQHRSVALFDLDGRGGWSTTSSSQSSVALAGFSVRRGGGEVGAVELPQAIPEAKAFLTGALLDEEKGALLASFAAITSVRWPGNAG